MSDRRPVLVTGASSGIGAETARLLAARGFAVWAGVRRADDGERLAAEAPSVRPVLLDVTDGASIAAALARIDGETGLYGLVNNAGIVVTAPLEAIPLDALRQQFEINVFGAMAVTQAALPSLRRSLGRVVNVGSIAGRNTLPFVGPYSASKHALRSLTDALRMELAPWEIGVTLIEPGAVKTPIWERAEKTNRALFESLAPLARERYVERFELLAKLAQTMGAGGIAAVQVARAIARALEARRAPTHTIVGNDARAQLFSTALPMRLRDRLLGALIARAAR